MRSKLRPILRCLRYLLHRYVPTRCKATRLEGRLPDTGTELAILTNGSPTARKHLAMDVLGGESTESPPGRAWRRKLIPCARRAAADVLLIGGIPRSRSLGSNQTIVCCRWLRSETDFDSVLERMRKSQYIKRRVNMFKKHDLKFEMTKDPERIKDFHYNMYLPFMQQRFPTTANATRFKVLQRMMDNLELALARQGDTYIAGILFQARGNTLVYWEVGYKDGDPVHMKTGAAVALKYHAFLTCVDRGFTKISFGYTSPFLRDGVLRYKKNWGVRLVDEGQAGTLIIPVTGSPRTQEFFEQTPMICIRDNKLVGTVFVRPDAIQSQKQLTQLHKEFYYDGMDHLHVLILNELGRCPPVPESLRGTMAIESAVPFFEAWEGRDQWLD